MEFIGSVAGKVVDLLFYAAIKELKYMWNYSENVQTFNEQFGKLKATRDMLQQRIDFAKHNAQKPREDLLNWMKTANSKITEAQRISDEEADSKSTCCNLYRYGRMATRKSASLQKHQEDGEQFKDYIFDCLPPTRNTDVYQRKNLENLNSQKSALENIICAIEKDNIQIVGIIGCGGVGKTTLACEVAGELKNKFDLIEQIEVRRTVNTEEIKKAVKIAADRIKNKEKVLIILDDVWEELKLDKVGIPCGSDYKKCKILVTTRNKDVCVDMNAQKIICLDPLPKQEAWTLFERVVGITEWDNKLKKVALRIVEKCGGLPLFVQTVGRTLKGKDIKRWEATLAQLQDPMDGVATWRDKDLRILKLSYDNLENELVKSCFLLCSLFPEDCSIGLRRLTYYVLALGILNNPPSIHAAKDNVLLAVESLVSSFLLHPVEKFNFYRVSHEGEEEEFKMHDLVRDMALFVTSEGDRKFLFRSGKNLIDWHPDNDVIKNYTKISLMGNKIQKLPEYELHLPHLDTLLVQDNHELSVVPEEFFRGMGNLKVLDMSRNHISSLPQSVNHLKNLHTLYLCDNSSLCEISILGELTCLVILMLRGTGIKRIPEEIGKLVNLRVLDVDYCPHPIFVTPGVISKLVWLEEFYIGIGKGDCTFVGELSELKSPKILHLKVPELDNFPKDFHHFENLKEFHIKDNVVWLSQTRGWKRILEISKRSFPLGEATKKLIRVSEMLELWGIRDLDNYFLDVVYPARADKLTYIVLFGCENVRSLVKKSDLDELGHLETDVKFFSEVEEIDLIDLDSLENLWDSPHRYISFSNLTRIYIVDCPSLLELFPMSVAQGLAKLKVLYISQCESLEALISAGIGMGDVDIMFAHLKDVQVFELPKLESFYRGYSSIRYPSLEFIQVQDCHSMRKWSYGENHIPKIKFEHEGQSYDNINDYIAAQLEMDDGELLMRDWCMDDTEGMYI